MNKVPIVLQCAGIFGLQCAGTSRFFTEGHKKFSVARAEEERALGGGVHIADLWLVQELAALTTNSSSKLHILRHHGDAFAVDSTKVAIFEDTNQKSL